MYHMGITNSVWQEPSWLNKIICYKYTAVENTTGPWITEKEFYSFWDSSGIMQRFTNRNTHILAPCLLKYECLLQKFPRLACLGPIRKPCGQATQDLHVHIDTLLPVGCGLEFCIKKLLLTTPLITRSHYIVNLFKLGLSSLNQRSFAPQLLHRPSWLKSWVFAL